MAKTEAIRYGDIPPIGKLDIGKLDDPECPPVGAKTTDGDEVLAIRPVSASWFMLHVISGGEVEPDVVFKDHSKLPLVVWAILLKRRPVVDATFED